MNARVGELRTEGPTPAGGAYAIAYFSRDGVPVDQSDATQVEITEYAADGTPIQRTYAILGAKASPASA